MRKTNFRSLSIAPIVLLALSLLSIIPAQADTFNNRSIYLLKSSEELNSGKAIYAIVKLDDATKNVAVLPTKTKGTPWLDKIASSINDFQELSDKTNGLDLYEGKGWKAQLKIKNTISHALQDAANNAWDGKSDTAVKNLHTAFHHVQNNMKKSSERSSSLVFIEKYISLLERS